MTNITIADLEFEALKLKLLSHLEIEPHGRGSHKRHEEWLASRRQIER